MCKEVLHGRIFACHEGVAALGFPANQYNLKPKPGKHDVSKGLHIRGGVGQRELEEAFVPGFLCGGYECFQVSGELISKALMPGIGLGSGYGYSDFRNPELEACAVVHADLSAKQVVGLNTVGAFV